VFRYADGAYSVRFASAPFFAVGAPSLLLDDLRSLYAHENGFDCFTTTNATSRWKDQEQVNSSGFRAAAKYNFMPYFWKYDWQTDAMTERKYRINAEQRFYKQVLQATPCRA